MLIDSFVFSPINILKVNKTQVIAKKANDGSWFYWQTAFVRQCFDTF